MPEHSPLVQTCRFVTASDVFKGLGLLWTTLVESDPPFSWGSNNRSLVSSVDLTMYLDGQGLDDPAGAQLTTLIERLDALPSDIYVDLEN